MYPSRFRYEAPTSIAEAIGILSSTPDAKVLAGGQSLIPMMKLRFASPATIVDINNIPGMDYHRAESDGTYRIGALCRHAHLEKSTTLHDDQPLLASAAELVADPIVRTRGTFVGSLCHADPQGDWASCMVALGGSVVAQGPSGKRAILVDELVSGPFTTILAPNEIAIEGVVPKAQGTRKGQYIKLERRVGDFATAGAAVSLDMDGGKVLNAGIGLTGVGARTINATEAADILTGSSLEPDVVKAAGEAAAAASSPRGDHRGSSDYKRHIISTFVQRIATNIRQSEMAGV